MKLRWRFKRPVIPPVGCLWNLPLLSHALWANAPFIGANKLTVDPISWNRSLVLAPSESRDMVRKECSVLLMAVWCDVSETDAASGWHFIFWFQLQHPNNMTLWHCYKAQKWEDRRSLICLVFASPPLAPINSCERKNTKSSRDRIPL